MNKLFKICVVLFFLVTIISGFVFIVVQQSYRHAADDPQLALAHDMAIFLSQGNSFIPSKHVDLSTTEGPFTIIFDKNGHIASSEAWLNNQPPVIPPGVFAFTLTHGIDRFTWQPQENVRIAAIVESYSQGFVLVGRSLTETENREMQLEQQVFLFWVLGTIVMISVSTALFIPGRKKS